MIVFSQKGNLMPARMGGYYQGALSVNRKGFGFLDLEDENSIHITEANLHGAMNGDVAIVKKRRLSMAVMKARSSAFCSTRRTPWSGRFSRLWARGCSCGWMMSGLSPG